jgi:glycosyltransferase involved in cell wall biosynthesis
MGLPLLASRRWASLLVGPPPPADRIFFHNIWFRGHNNPRYAALLPRLRRLDPFLVTCSDRRIVRGLQFRTLHTTRALRNRAVFAAAGRRYHNTFSTGPPQVAYAQGPVVVDVDDPRFTADEVELLGRPQVKAVVVTAESARQRYLSLGLDKACHIIPQGVSFSILNPARVVDVAAELRRPGDFVVGYVAAWLLTEGDRDGRNPLYNIDHLLDLWNEVHSRLPHARLWLAGQASERVRRSCARRDDIVLLGRLAPEDVLAHLSNVDLALYPRRVDHAPFAVKVAEYMGLGIPTVAYELELTKMLRDAGAGVLVSSPRAFVDAVVHLAGHPDERARLAESGRSAGKEFDWDILAARYEREILDRYLP